LKRYGRALTASRDYLRALLSGVGVDVAYVDDVTQDIRLEAWPTITCGLYQPTQTAEGGKPFKRWLDGAAWRSIGHYRGSVASGRPASGGVALRAAQAEGTTVEALLGAPNVAVECPHCGTAREVKP
jgi:hypothetical protein